MSFVAFIKRTLFWLKDIKSGGGIWNQYRYICKFFDVDFAQAKQMQSQDLEDLLTYVTTNSDFYKKYQGCQLADFPVVNKSILIEHYNEVVISPEVIPNQEGKVHIQCTLGSTGTPFAVPQDTLKRKRRIAELKYFGKVVGFKSHDMLVHLRTWNKWQQKTPKQIKEERIIPFDIANMGEERLAELCDIIRENKAICVRAYASSYDILSKYLKEHPQIFPALKICIAGSEALHDDVRANVKKYLHCEIISQYADEECGILAQERIPTSATDNVMYLNHSGYIFEFLKKDCDEPAEYGELARIVITDLHNYAFPMLRYDTGDVGVMLPPNEYSKGWPILGKLYGRRLDICYDTKGNPFSPMTVGRIMKHFDKVLQWQFIQKGEKEYLLKIIMQSDIDGVEYMKTSIDALKEYIGNDANIIIEFVDDIPVLASGKRKPVVNEWKNIS